MKLIGYMDSPFVRRVAVTARLIGVELEHEQISVLREYERFEALNPLVKAPTLICDDGQVLVDSTLIIDYLVSRNGGDGLMPSDEAGYVRALSLTGTALVAMEKTVQLFYERKQRPAELVYPPWVDRCRNQLGVALGMLEAAVEQADDWLCGKDLTQADVSAAVAWGFKELQMADEFTAKEFPALAAFAARAEALPAFEACPF